MTVSRLLLVRTLLRAFVLRDPEAMHDLGAMHGSGEFPSTDPHLATVKAFQYYTRGARMGHAACQYDLGFMYWAGDLGEKNEEEGLKWIRMAASQGYDAAVDLLRDIGPEEG